jgi:hypothetical protein
MTPSEFSSLITPDVRRAVRQGLARAGYSKELLDETCDLGFHAVDEALQAIVAVSARGSHQAVELNAALLALQTLEIVAQAITALLENSKLPLKYTAPFAMGGDG